MKKSKTVIRTCIAVFLVAGFIIATVNAATGISTITSNFHGTTISAGNWIWFNSHFNPGAPVADGDWVKLTSSQITINGYGTITVPDAIITFSATATSATTTFDSVTNTWLTIIPLWESGNDEIFLSGLAYLVPGSISGGPDVTWSGVFESNKDAFSLSWQWGAAVYTYMPTVGGSPNYKALNVKLTHDSLHAGTPQAIKNFVIGGARGGGGSNYTGSWSNTGTVVAMFVVPESALGTILVPTVGLAAFASFRVISKRRKQK